MSVPDIAYPAGRAAGRVLGSAAKADDVDQLFRAAYPKLAGWVRRLVVDDDTAHEIASEAFVRLLSRWPRPGNPQSYLYRIAANLVKDHWRKTERERRAMRRVTAGAAPEAVNAGFAIGRSPISCTGRPRG
jgi:RNA polymerase sigma-70 factor (ECF subfamily)